MCGSKSLFVPSSCSHRGCSMNQQEEVCLCTTSVLTAYTHQSVTLKSHIQAPQTHEMSSCWRHLTRHMFDIYGFIDELCSLCTHVHARDASGTMEPLFVRPDSAFILRDLWKDESELVFLQCNLSPWTGLRLLLCYMTRHFFLPAGDWISREQQDK